jgi:hypothetical protein
MYFWIVLEGLVEQTVALEPEEAVELPVSLEPLEDELLLAADRFLRVSALDRHRASAASSAAAPRGSRRRVAVDPQPHSAGKWSISFVHQDDRCSRR